MLVVDDKQAVRSYLNDLFILQGWRVTQASNGEEALAACRAEAPHVVLTDLAMEPVNGRDLISAANFSALTSGGTTNSPE